MHTEEAVRDFVRREFEELIGSLDVKESLTAFKEFQIKDPAMQVVRLPGCPECKHKSPSDKLVFGFAW